MGNKTAHLTNFAIIQGLLCPSPSPISTNFGMLEQTNGLCLHAKFHLHEIWHVASYTLQMVTWHGTVAERRSRAGELSLSCARPAADGWPLVCVNRLLQISQLGQLSLSGLASGQVSRIHFAITVYWFFFRLASYISIIFIQCDSYSFTALPVSREFVFSVIFQ